MNRGAFSAMEDIFIDVQEALGVPFTNLIFRNLASWPQVLAVLWRSARPIVLTSNFANQADRLRCMALRQPAALDFAWPPNLAPEEIERIMRFTDAYIHVQPQLLLLVAGWARAVTGPGVLDGEESHRLLDPREAPGRGDPSVDIPMITVPPSDPFVGDLFRVMAEQRGHPGVASYYRGLAQWPSLLAECWRIVRPSLTEREQRTRDLVKAADLAAIALGLHSIGTRLEQADSVGSMLQAWRDVQVPELMLDTARVKLSFPVASTEELRSL
jgi:hypothetical protein